MIELSHLTKRYGSEAVVSDLSLVVRAQELLVLLGGSGSGKTTTLKMVNRLVEPTSGAVRLEGTSTADVPADELRRQIGYAFQGVGLFPHMTVGENVGITPRLLGWEAERTAARVDTLLEIVELPPGEFRDRNPRELSGGQQQRVGVARALAAEPRVVLFDEPFGALDPMTRDRLQSSFRRIRRELDLTGMFVTHDLVEALLLGDRIAVLRDGRLIQVGTPRELLDDPADEGIADLFRTPERQAARIEALLEEARSR